MDAFTSTLLRNQFNDFNFERAFRTWENQGGFPLLHVEYDPATSAYMLTQQRFFQEKSLRENDESSWYIPINFATSDNPNFDDTMITHYFEETEAFKQIQAEQSDWYVFNRQQLSYYRVDYDVNNWNALKNVLNSDAFTSIHVMNRVQLIDDSFALANAGYHENYQLAFDIMKYLERETDFFPFYPTFRYILNLWTVFGPSNVYLNVR